MSKFFIICERDAGLFSLIQQVIASLPRALNNCAIPVVYFAGNCCYWVPEGYRGKDNVWEYYFEPLLQSYSSDTIPEEVKLFAQSALSDAGLEGVRFNQDYYLSNNFGDHSLLRNECLVIPFEWRDPDPWLRGVASRLIEMFVRPRQYIQDRAAEFVSRHFTGHRVIGLHIRGTDAVSQEEGRLFRKNSLAIERYLEIIAVEKQKTPDAKIFVATDSVDSLSAIKEVYGDSVLSYSTILHAHGQAAGKGPTGALMPSYFASDPNIAVENGAEAVVDFLILRRCDLLIHNGASLARTVLLSDPVMPHYNTHRPSWKARWRAFSIRPRAIRRKLQSWDERLRRNTKIRFEQWIDFLERI